MIELALDSHKNSVAVRFPGRKLYVNKRAVVAADPIFWNRLFTGWVEPDVELKDVFLLGSKYTVHFYNCS